MRIVTALISCLMALSGCDPKPGTTSITRSSENGTQTLFSKTTQRDGVATFECFASASGDCRYLVYADDCTVDGAAPASQTDCRRQTLDSFVLAVGTRHEVRGLPAGFGHCVAQARKGPDAADGCG